MKVEIEIEDGLAGRVMEALSDQGADDASRLHKATMFAAAQAEFSKKRETIMRQAEAEVETCRIEINKFYGLE